MTDMTGVVEQVLADYLDRWNAYDADGMIAFWDSEDDGIIYVAEEIDTLHGWPALEAYIRNNNPEFAEHLISVRDVTARSIAPGVIQAFWNMSWSIYFVTEALYPKPIGGDVRVSALLREKDDGWKFFHWIEGPIAALFQLQRALERKADPRLLEKLKAKNISV